MSEPAVRFPGEVLVEAESDDVGRGAIEPGVAKARIDTELPCSVGLENATDAGGEVVVERTGGTEAVVDRRDGGGDPVALLEFHPERRRGRVLAVTALVDE